jgi:hypothetical protein
VHQFHIPASIETGSSVTKPEKELSQGQHVPPDAAGVRSTVADT